MGCIEFWGIYNPSEHFLAICGGHLLGFDGGHCELGKDVAVDVCQSDIFFYAFLGLGAYAVDFVGAQHGVAHGDYGFVVYGCKGGVVVEAFGNCGHLVCGYFHVKYGCHALVVGYKPYVFAVGIPCEFFDCIVPV